MRLTEVDRVSMMATEEAGDERISGCQITVLTNMFLFWLAQRKIRSFLLLLLCLFFVCLFVVVLFYFVWGWCGVREVVLL